MWSLHGGRSPDQPDLPERVLASMAYLLPALDGFEYGSALYHLPMLREMANFVAPAVAAYQGIPFSNLLFFLALSAFASGSLRGSLSGFVRFNIQQALFLDMLLMLPYLVPETGNWILHTAGPGALIFGRNLIWSAWTCVVAYSAVCNSQGNLPDQVPVISPAAKSLIS